MRDEERVEVQAGEKKFDLEHLFWKWDVKRIIQFFCRGVLWERRKSLFD